MATKKKPSIVKHLKESQFKEDRLNKLTDLLKKGDKRLRLIEELVGLEMKYQMQELGRKFEQFERSPEATILRSLKEVSSLFGSVALNYFSVIRHENNPAKNEVVK